MKERKYINDWINEVRLNKKTGRDERVPVYTGKWYKADAKGKSLAARKGTYCILLVLCIALTILFFWVDDAATRNLLVFLPAALSFFPMFYWILGVWTVYRLKDRFTRVQKEKSYGRIQHSSIGCGICLGLAFAGNVGRLLTGGPMPGDIPGTALLLSAAAAAFAAFRQQQVMERHITEHKEMGDNE